MEGELKRFYFHSSDGLDLVLDREGIEADGSEVLWWALKAADRLMSALPTYDGWSAWTVSVHDARGCLVETVPFPKNVDTSDALSQRKGSIHGHNAHLRTSTRPEARGIIDAYWTRSVSIYHQ